MQTRVTRLAQAASEHALQEEIERWDSHIAEYENVFLIRVSNFWRDHAARPLEHTFQRTVPRRLRATPHCHRDASHRTGAAQLHKKKTKEGTRLSTALEQIEGKHSASTAPIRPSRNNPI